MNIEYIDAFREFVGKVFQTLCPKTYANKHAYVGPNVDTHTFMKFHNEKKLVYANFPRC